MRVRLSGKLSFGLLCCALILAVAAPAVAADTLTALRSESMWIQSAPALAEPSVKRIAAVPASAVVKPEPRAARNINLDFHAADITDVLKALSVQSGTNIVTGTDVKGQVTVSLNKVSLNEALDMVTKLSGYKYASVAADTYLVGSAQGLNAVLGVESIGQQIVYASIAVQYANPKDLAKAIQEQVPTVKVSVGSGFNDSDTEDSETKKASADDVPKGLVKPTGALLLSGPEKDVAIARSIIAQVEDSVQAGGPDSIMEIYWIKYADAAELMELVSSTAPAVSIAYGPRAGFQREKGDVVQVGFTGANGSGDAADKGKEMYALKNQPDALVLTGPSRDVMNALALLEQVDVRQPQVLIEARVIDISNDAARDLGIEWTWGNLTASGRTDVENIEVNDPVSNLRTVTRTAVYGPANIQAKVNLMVTDGKAKILANPKVAMVSGKPARIFIGDEVRYISETVLGPGQSSQKTEIVPVGILLDAVGVVGQDGEITLYLHPEVSTVTKYVGNIPQVARRYTDSTIRVKDGGTVVIGGLIREEERVAMSKIPLLGDLPFVGQLFRNTSKGKTNSEIAIFITATVLKDK